MPGKRPAIVLVLAIINMVAGGLLLLCGTCAALSNAFVPAALSGTAGPNVFDYAARELPGYQVIEVTHGVLLLLLGVLALLSGIGLLGMHSWARWLAVLYALGMVVLNSGYVTYEAGFVSPVITRFQTEHYRELHLASPDAAASQAVGRVAGIIGVGILFLADATFTLIVLFLPGVAAAFAGGGAAAGADEGEVEDLNEVDEEDDVGYERRRRRRLADEE